MNKLRFEYTKLIMFNFLIFFFKIPINQSCAKNSCKILIKKLNRLYYGIINDVKSKGGC